MLVYGALLLLAPLHPPSPAHRGIFVAATTTPVSSGNAPATCRKDLTPFQLSKVQHIFQSVANLVLHDCCDTAFLGNHEGLYWLKGIVEEKRRGMCIIEASRRHGAWLVIARRKNPTRYPTKFVRPWKQYVDGFGKLGNGNFWWGLQAIHELTSAAENELRMEFRLKGTETWKYVHYNRFHVGGPDTNYTLTIDGHSGNLDNSFSELNGTMFSTYDQDNDNKPWNCLGVPDLDAGWWIGARYFSICTPVHPLGQDRILYKEYGSRIVEYDKFVMSIRAKHFPCEPYLPEHPLY